MQKGSTEPARGISPAPASAQSETGTTGRVVAGLVNRQWFMSLLGWCGVRGLLWRLYCRLFGPRGGIVRVELAAQSARFYVHSERVAADLLSCGGEQKLLERLASMLKPGDAVYDIGAGMGLYSVFWGQVVGTRGVVIAFEPSPFYFDCVRGNVALNGLRNTRIFRLALGDRTCELKLLPLQRGTDTTRVAALPPAESWSQAGFKVRVVEGDRLIADEKLPAPCAVKIDVEGHEAAVLRGLRRALSDPACRVVCCEVHPQWLPQGVGPDEIVGLLKACGFNRFEVFPRPPEQHVLAFKE